MRPDHQEIFRVMFAEESVPEPVQAATEKAEVVLERLGGSKLNAQGLIAVVGGVQLLADQQVSSEESATVARDGADVPSVTNTAQPCGEKSGNLRGSRFHPDPRGLTVIPCGSSQYDDSGLGPGSRVDVTYYGRVRRGGILDALAEEAQSWRIKLDFDLLPWREIEAEHIAPASA